MSGKIEIKATRVLSYEEIPVRISSDANVGELLEQAAPKLQINPQGAAIMVQGVVLSSLVTLSDAGIKEGDTAVIAPGPIVGGIQKTL